MFSIGRMLATIAFRMSEAITTMTPELGSTISSLYAVPERKIIVVPFVGRNFLESEKTTGPFTVLYYGNLGPNYDFDFLLEVACLLLKTGVRFTLRGEGEQLRKINAAVKRMGLNNVQMITKVLDEGELSDLVVSADVLILPMSKSVFTDVSFPGKFVEYLRAGKPIVYVGDGLPSVLVEKYNLGLSTSVHDAATVALFILKLKDEPGSAELFGSNSKRIAKENYSEVVLADSLRKLDGILLSDTR